jgi:hypothetical protein
MNQTLVRNETENGAKIAVSAHFEKSAFPSITVQPISEQPTVYTIRIVFLLEKLSEDMSCYYYLLHNHYLCKIIFSS